MWRTALWLALSITTQAAAQESSTRLDIQGDPLPGVASARYGTTRFRHERALQSVAFSPDRRLIASSARDFTLRLWDRTTGKQLGSLLTHSNRQVYEAPAASTPSVRFSSDGKYLAAARGDGAILVWETQGRKLIHRFAGPGAGALTLAFSADGKTLAAGGADSIIRIWDIASGKETRQLAMTDPVTALVYSTNSQLLFAGTASGLIRIWHLASSQVVRQMELAEGSVQDLALSPDGGVLASAGSDKVIRLWAVRADTNPQFAPFLWSALAWPAVQSGLAIVQELQFIALNRELRQLKGHQDAVTAVAFESDATLVSGSLDRTIRLWDVTKGTEFNKRRIQAGPTTCLDLDRSEGALAAGDADASIRLWNLSNAREVTPERGPLGQVEQIAYSPDGTGLVTVNKEGRLRVWDTATGRLRGVFPAMDSAAALAAAISPDGRTGWLATPNDLRSIDAVALKPWDRFKPGRLDPSIRLLVAPGRGDRVAWAADSELYVWSRADGVQTWLPSEKFDAPARLLVVGPDGNTGAASSENDVLVVWDLSSRREIRRLSESGAVVTAAAVSPDGKSIASGHADGAVRIWQLDSGIIEHQFDGLPGPVRSLTFAADGKSLAVGSWLTVRLWELSTLQERLRLNGLPGEATSLAIAPDKESIGIGFSSTQALRCSLIPDGIDQAAWSSERAEIEWKALASLDGAAAYRALTYFILHKDKSTPFLSPRQRPVPGLEPDRQRQWLAAIKNLGDPSFEVREKAARELKTAPDSVEALLRESLTGRSPGEVQFRLKTITQSRLTPEKQSERRRGARICEILESLGSPAALAVLREYSEGARGAWLTEDARAAVERLDRRRK